MLKPWQPIFTIGTQFKSIATDWQIIYSNVNNYTPRDIFWHFVKCELGSLSFSCIRFEKGRRSAAVVISAIASQQDRLWVQSACSTCVLPAPLRRLPGFLPQSKHTDVRAIACACECQRGRMSVSLHRPCGEPAGCPGCNPAFTPRQLGLCSSTLESQSAGEAVMENRKKKKKTIKTSVGWKQLLVAFDSCLATASPTPRCLESLYWLNQHLTNHAT